MPVIIGLAVRRYGWSVREALLAATLNAAWVLGWSDERGSLEAGKRADVLLLDGPAEHVPYRFGHNPVAARSAPACRCTSPRPGVAAARRR